MSPPHVEPRDDDTLVDNLPGETRTCPMPDSGPHAAIGNKKPTVDTGPGSSNVPGVRLVKEDIKNIPGDKHILTELECYHEIGFGFSNRKKWTILTVM